MSWIWLRYYPVFLAVYPIFLERGTTWPRRLCRAVTYVAERRCNDKLTARMTDLLSRRLPGLAPGALNECHPQTWQEADDVPAGSHLVDLPLQRL